MCGIASIAAKYSDSLTDLPTFLQALHHRGLDYVEHRYTADQRVVLSTRCLAIRGDLSAAGHMPITAFDYVRP